MIKCDVCGEEADVTFYPSMKFEESRLERAMLRVDCNTCDKGGMFEGGRMHGPLHPEPVEVTIPFKKSGTAIDGPLWKSGETVSWRHTLRGWM